MKYIIFLIILSLIIYYLISGDSEHMVNLNMKSRENSDCVPINKTFVTENYNGYWSYVMPDSCENGLPHTRGYNIIAIPQSYLSKKSLPKTIKHEKVHLNQKQYPDLWRKFYKNYWNYEIFRGFPMNMPNELILHRRTNPDTEDMPFARWDRKWWSVAVYNNVNNPKVGNYSVKWWNEETNKVSDVAPEEWVNFFGKDNAQDEHPHEISANFIMDILSENKENSMAKSILLSKWNDRGERLEI